MRFLTQTVAMMWGVFMKPVSYFRASTQGITVLISYIHVYDMLAQSLLKGPYYSGVCSIQFSTPQSIVQESHRQLLGEISFMGRARSG